MGDGIRAVWADIYREFRSPGDIARYADWCGRHGLTLTFPCVNHLIGAVTYPSEVAARAAAYEAWDPMPELVRASRAAGLAVHVWVCMAHGGPVDMGRPGSLEISAAGPRPVTETHPEWFNVDQTGASMLQRPNARGSQAPHAFLNLCRPGARDYLTRLSCEILDRYEVDGVHLDYIRFCFKAPEKPAGGQEAYNPKGRRAGAVRLDGSRRYSFDEPTLRDFQAETGIDFFGSGDDLASRVAWLYADEARREAWYAWKASKVTALVARLRAETAERGRKLSAAVFGGYPWCGQEVAQRWPGWVDGRLLDLVVPMDYDREPDVLADLLADQFSHLEIEPKPAVPFLAGISSTSFRELDPAGAAERLAAFEETARAGGQTGVSLYSYSSFKGLLG